MKTTRAINNRRRRDRRPHGTTAQHNGHEWRPAAPARPPARRVADSTSWLRQLLVALDAVAFAVGWLVALVSGRGAHPLTSEPARAVGFLVAVTVGSLLFTASQRLYLARVSSVREEEKARLARVAVFSFVFALLVAEVLALGLSKARLAWGAVLVFALQAVFRLIYQQWLKIARARGRFARPILLVGVNDEGAELYELLTTHAEIGLRVEGLVGSREAAARLGIESLWRGDVGDVHRVIDERGVNGVLIAASALSPHELRRVVRDLLGRGIHVHLSTGLMGFDPRRLRSLPLSHEPLFYVEPLTLARWQHVLKRTIDVVLSAVSLVVAAPILALAAVAIKLQDRGPVLFRQTRIGRAGEPFTFLKLRTMYQSAEDDLDEVRDHNERSGPLFKQEEDPRRTAVGRLLEASSIDELPQLINVLRGSMSLVGPRPALPSEVAQFDTELLARHRMRPGITGLWQVEGRDNPSFQAYRRLDLFYVENWSITLDLAILFTTMQAVIARTLLRTARLFRRSPKPEPEVTPARARAREIAPTAEEATS
ncbi:MAG: sugar transferase [Acidimicrobiia bacterium]|nr:sugar transferase [Acidimicrobiia bacterium]